MRLAVEQVEPEATRAESGGTPPGTVQHQGHRSEPPAEHRHHLTRQHRHRRTAPGDQDLQDHHRSGPPVNEETLPHPLAAAVVLRDVAVRENVNSPMDPPGR